MSGNLLGLYCSYIYNYRVSPEHRPTIIVSKRIAEKLAAKSPPVTPREVEQCFENRTGKLLLDTREQHQTDPPTLWFIAETNNRRLLKVVLIIKSDGVHIKSAYDPNEDEKRIYLNKA